MAKSKKNLATNLLAAQPVVETLAAQPVVETPAAQPTSEILRLTKPDYSSLDAGDTLPGDAVVFGPDATANQYWTTMVKPGAVKSWIRFMTQHGPSDIRTLVTGSGAVIPPTEVVVALWDRVKTVSKLVKAIKARDFSAEAERFNWTAGVEMCKRAGV